MTAPNPMVGAVLVHNNTVIGEGYHKTYGKAHAEVNCINEALKNAPGLISSSTLFVSLEPCAHFGKTPPCADLIIAHKIPNVVVACRDSFNEVNGRGIAKLEAAGINVTEGVLQNEAIYLNRRFFTFHNRRRPFVVLKWAQSSDGFISGENENRLLISNAQTNRLVHKWRSEEAGILVGANTAIKDDPLLDNRHWFGRSPVKIVVDPNLRCRDSLRLFQANDEVIVFNKMKNLASGKINFIQVEESGFLKEMFEKLYELKIQSVLVEGGQKTLQSIINAGLWDEARVITNTSLTIEGGLRAPKLTNAKKSREEKLLTDRVEYFEHAGSGLL